MRLRLSLPLALGAQLARRAPRALSPAAWYAAAGRALPWLWAAAIVCALVGTSIDLGVVPSDARHGDAFRIAFVHVPSAWLALLIFVAMAACGALALLWPRSDLAPMLAGALAPTGALMTFLALWTGSLWGRPAWGAWWVWDARLAALLLLLALYGACIALRLAAADAARGERRAATLALACVLAVPIVYYSVGWWNSIHDGASLDLARVAPRLGGAMVGGLLLAHLGFAAWTLAATAHRLRTMLLEREAASEWVRRLPEVRSSDDLERLG